MQVLRKLMVNYLQAKYYGCSCQKCLRIYNILVEIQCDGNNYCLVTSNIVTLNTRFPIVTYIPLHINLDKYD